MKRTLVIKLTGKAAQVFEYIALLARFYPNDTLGQIVNDQATKSPCLLMQDASRLDLV